MGNVMEVSAKMVKELRQASGAGIMDCKKALAECDCDMQKATEYLRIKGITKAAGKSGREVSEGSIGTYVHSTGKIGVMVEINCETDFVARTDEFKEFISNVAMHIAGSSPVPLFVKSDEVDKDTIEKERNIFIAQAQESGKPDNIIEKMVTGRVQKYLKEICLLDQKYIKNPDITIADLVTEKITALGENISIKRFVRYNMS